MKQQIIAYTYVDSQQMHTDKICFITY